MVKKLFATSFIVLCIGLFTSLIGLLKEIYIAHQFGTHSSIDIFYLGLSIPFFLAGLCGSAINATIIPAYLEAKQNEKAQEFLLDTLQLVLIVMAGLSVISALFAIFIQPHLIKFSLEKIQLIIQATLILSPLILIQGLISFFDGVLNAEKRIILNNIASVMIPVGTIVVLTFVTQLDFKSLCVGLYLGYLLKLTSQIFIIWRNFNFKSNTLRFLPYKNYLQLIQEFFWLVFSSAILGLMPVVSNFYASYLGAGQVASLNYANKLLSTGLMIVGIVINSVLFPHIAERIVENKTKGIQQGIKLSIFSIIIFSIFIIPIFILSEWIVQLFFERGKFTHQDTLHVASILKYLLLYIPFYVSGLLLSRLVVSLNKSSIFILGNIISIVLFTSSGWLFIQYYQMGVESLGISLLIVYMVSSFYLLFNILVTKKSYAY